MKPSWSYNGHKSIQSSAAQVRALEGQEVTTNTTSPQAGMQFGLDLRNAQMVSKATPQLWIVQDEFTESCISDSLTSIFGTFICSLFLFLDKLASKESLSPKMSTSQHMSIPEPKPKCNCWIQKQ